MADYVISSGDAIRPLRNPLGQFVIESLGESTSQVFVYGDVLEIDRNVSTSSHRVKRASTSGSTVTSTTIVGVAAQGASSNVDQRVPFYSANSLNTFWGRTRGGVLASSNIGSGYGLFRDSTKNVFLVDLGNGVSTSVRVIVTDFVDQLGDSGGAVAFRFGTFDSTGVIFGFGSAR